jgi:hypothetical protein
MANYSSSQSGNWSSTATWGGSGPPPAAGDTATVSTGHTVTVDANTTVGSNGSGIGPGVTVNGTLNVNGGVTLTLRGFDSPAVPYGVSDTCSNPAMLIAAGGTVDPPQERGEPRDRVTAGVHPFLCALQGRDSRGAG